MPPPPPNATLAAAAFQRGDWAEADAQCRGILAADADNYEALTILGILAAKTGRAELAVDLLSRAAAAHPERAEAHGNVGNVLHEFGRHDAALACYDRALAINPDYAIAFNNRGHVLRSLRRFDDALASFERAVRIKPDYAEAHDNRGVALRDLKRYEEALESHERALAIKSDHVAALSHCGVALCDLKRYEEALASFDRALAIRPNHADAWSNRGVALAALGRPEEAVESHDRAIVLSPNNSAAHTNRGNALCDLQRRRDALESYDRAIALNPDNVDAHTNRGNALCDLHRSGDALESYERALAIDPDDINAHWNLSLCLLRTGDFARGWQEYEWRWKQPEWQSVRHEFPGPLWLGMEPVRGRTMLLHCEQGLGDTLQFCRYATQIAALGAKVVLVVQRPLLPLLAGLQGIAKVLPLDAELPAFDYHCPLLSLPLAFGTRSHTIPEKGPYLHADALRVDAWRSAIGTGDKTRVGFVWSGNPAHKNDRYRSLVLAEALPLLSDRVAWVSLQKDVRDVDRTVLASRPDIVRCGERLGDFADTAALIEVMDLVVTVDTSVAHLAGAMGKPVWILLPFNPDWRWMLERTDSPWYSSVRLFRQSAAGDWSVVLNEVRGELERTYAIPPARSAMP